MDNRLRLVAYNMGQGGVRNPALRARLLADLAPDLLFLQETRNPSQPVEQAWLTALSVTTKETYLWQAAGSGRWGSGLWARAGKLTALAVPEEYAGRVVAALVEGLTWPVAGTAPVVALSIHAPTRKGSTYIKEVGFILDTALRVAEGRPIVLGGDFNVVVGMRQQEHRPSVSRSEQSLLERFRDELNMVPCWQTAHPGEPLARTLRWMHRTDSLPYHCDGIFIPASWAAALDSCTVLEDEEWCTLSDHNPVVADLNVTGA